MEIIKMSEVEQAQNPHGIEARKVLRKENVQVVYLRFKPGQKLPLHTTGGDVFFHVIVGTGMVTVGDEQAEVSEKTIVFSPAHIPHALENAGNGPLEVMVVKTPNPEPLK